MRRLEDNFFVSGQIAPADLPALAAQGFTLIVNNRPDGEEPDQPDASEIEAAAAEAGLAYRFVPVAQLTPEAATGMREALQTDNKVLAFCRSGTRSTYLWALARSGQGHDVQTLVEAAADAGYDLSPIRGFLR